jgi:hypothetical protein
VPRSDDPKYVEKTLDSRTVAQYGTESQWLSLLTYEGPQLNFNPESVSHLRDFLRDFLVEEVEEKEPPTFHKVLSEMHRVELSEGWLTIITANRAYDLSDLATSRLKVFLSEVLPKEDSR